MTILYKLLSFIGILKKLFDSFQKKIKENKIKKEKKSIENLSEKTKINIEKGYLKEINKNLL